MSSNDWRHEMMHRIRELIEAADPEVTEEAKWAKATNPGGVPTWSHDGIICTGETYKDKIKLTFMYGASLDDPTKMFNASLDVGTRRAIDFFEDSPLDETAFTALIRAAVDFNVDKASTKRRK